MTPTRVERAAVWGTVAYLLVTAAAMATAALVAPAVVAYLVLFGAGCFAFVVALVKAADRSRTEAVTLGGLFWLPPSVPAGVRRRLRAAFVVQCLVALVAPFVRQPLAFGVFVPVFGLGCLALWAGLAASFPDRPAAGR